VGEGGGASPDTFPKLWSVTLLLASLCATKKLVGAPQDTGSPWPNCSTADCSTSRIRNKHTHTRDMFVRSHEGLSAGSLNTPPGCVFSSLQFSLYPPPPPSHSVSTSMYLFPSEHINRRVLIHVNVCTVTCSCHTPTASNVGPCTVHRAHKKTYTVGKMLFSCTDCSVLFQQCFY
jgi:hypothetical protein